MLNKLIALFRRPTPFDVEKAVAHYLLTTPRCASRILIIGCRYQDEIYKDVELTVSVPNLSAWIVKSQSGVFYRNDEEQRATRLAFSLWLDAANLSDASVTHLPPYFYKLLHSYDSIIGHSLWDVEGVEIYCNQCRSLVDAAEKTIEDTERYGCGYHDITVERKCPAGHLLHQETHRIHVYPNHFHEASDGPMTIPEFLRQRSKN